MAQHVRADLRGAQSRCAASVFNSRARCWRVRWPLSPNDGNSHFDWASVFDLLQQCEIIRCRALRCIVERHDAFLVAFAAHDDDASVSCAADIGKATSRRRASRSRKDFDQTGEPCPRNCIGAVVRIDSRAVRNSRSTSAIEMFSARPASASVLQARRPGRLCAGLPRRGNDKAAGSRKAAAPLSPASCSAVPDRRDRRAGRR